MKLSELKAKVYRIAEVTTTRQLKAQYAEIKSLDLRYKASWEKALEILKSDEQLASESKPRNIDQKKRKAQKAKSRKSEARNGGIQANKSRLKKRGKKTKTETSSVEKSAEQNSTDFAAWLNNPPAEYRDLFAETEEALAGFDDKLGKAKQLMKTAKLMADSLDEFAEASVEEAKQLAKIAQQQRKTAEQADLN